MCVHAFICFIYRLISYQFSQGVPIEVVPFAYAKVLQNLHEIIGSPNATLRMAKMKAGPVVSDNANFIIDAPFGREVMKDPYTVSIRAIFCRIALRDAF